MYLVCYDIKDNDERRRTSKILEGFGLRVQKSVFECSLTKRGYQQLLTKLEDLELTSGYVAVYLLSANTSSVCLGCKETKALVHASHAFVV